MEHGAGTTCVPNHPQRIVALDSISLEHLLSLGIRPIGATFSGQLDAHLQQDLIGIENIGSAGEPNLEKIVALQPDLIIGEKFYQTIYSQSSQISPTILYGFEHSGQWKFDNEIQVSISRELLHQADGDVMFAWTGENTPEANQQAQQKLAALKSDPLWQGLNVVQQDKIYQVPSYWIGGGMIAANLIIDDLFKYLIEIPQP